jgi:Uma2 family endonuclease
MAMPLRYPESLMTLDEWITLPEDNTFRYELQECVLLVSPRPIRRHQLAAQRLSQQLDGQLPVDWESVLAVEIISPGSRNIDLHLKPFEYAEAGIPHYWLVDLDPPAPSITVFRLGAPDDGYVEGSATAGRLVTTVPFDLCIDIPALVAPRSYPSRSRNSPGLMPACRRIDARVPRLMVLC